MKNHTIPKRILMISALAGALALGGTALARPGGGGGGQAKGHGGKAGGPAMKMMRLMSSLDLTEEQEVQLVRIKRELRKEHKALRIAGRADQQAALAEMSKDAPNAQVFHAMIDRQSAARVALAHKALDRVIAFQATLSPDQKATLQAKLQKIEQRRSKRRARASE